VYTVIFVILKACASTTPGATTAAGATTGGATTAAATTRTGRKRRSSDSATVELHSNVQASNSGLLLQKLKNAAAGSDLDASKYGHVEHQLSVASDGTALLVLHVPSASDCGELRQNVQKVVKQVDEVYSSLKYSTNLNYF
jgi:hypothetical protein